MATFRLTAAGVSASARAATENGFGTADEGFEVGERLHRLTSKQSLKIIQRIAG
jgi:hypothetical protein